jgi:hypothetical protein
MQASELRLFSAACRPGRPVERIAEGVIRHGHRMADYAFGYLLRPTVRAPSALPGRTRPACLAVGSRPHCQPPLTSLQWGRGREGKTRRAAPHSAAFYPSPLAEEDREGVPRSPSHNKGSGQ